MEKKVKMGKTRKQNMYMSKNEKIKNKEKRKRKKQNQDTESNLMNNFEKNSFY